MVAVAQLRLVDVDTLNPRYVEFVVDCRLGACIWTTRHRYSELRRLKDTLQSCYGPHHLPDPTIFPEREGLLGNLKKLFTPCFSYSLDSKADGHESFLGNRRRRLEEYFGSILTDHRETWDKSDQLRETFCPGAPTSYCWDTEGTKSKSKQRKTTGAKYAATAGAPASLDEAVRADVGGGVTVRSSLLALETLLTDGWNGVETATGDDAFFWANLERSAYDAPSAEGKQHGRRRGRARRVRMNAPWDV